MSVCACDYVMKNKVLGTYKAFKNRDPGILKSVPNFILKHTTFFLVVLTPIVLRLPS